MYPGAMFMLAYLGDIPVVGLPGCVMYHKASIFDVVVPRLLARYSGHPLGKAVVAAFQERTGEEPEPVSDSRVVAGRAVSGRIDGTEVAVGKPDYFIARV